MTPVEKFLQVLDKQWATAIPMARLNLPPKLVMKLMASKELFMATSKKLFEASGAVSFMQYAQIMGSASQVVQSSFPGQFLACKTWEEAAPIFQDGLFTLLGVELSPEERDVLRLCGECMMQPMHTSVALHLQSLMKGLG